MTYRTETHTETYHGQEISYTQTFLEAAVSFHAYQCTCVAGFANGWCEYDIIPEYTNECTVLESHDGATGNCDIDVDECASFPCQNGATCTDSTVEAPVTYRTETHTETYHGKAITYNQTFLEPAVSFHTYQCTCVAGFANGWCEYDFISEYARECTVFESTNGTSALSITSRYGVASSTYETSQIGAAFGTTVGVSDLSGNCDIDADECASSPCQNGATCTDSTVEPTVSFHTYQCTCMAGFANGWCMYDYIDEYLTECTVFESSDAAQPIAGSGSWVDGHGFGGNCDTDVDECASSPCANGATCSDSIIAGTGIHPVDLHSYRCTCVDGYANGWCTYDYISEVFQQCTVVHSEINPVYTGNCDADVDECTSFPCTNSASCLESSDKNTTISAHSYQCGCIPGFTNGECQYEFITEYDAICTVYESEENAAYSGNCDVDLDECASNPCQSGATCSESTVDALISVHSYRCTCTAGHANGLCEYNFITEYTELCSVLESSGDDPDGGGNCDTDVDECRSHPCHNGGSCYDSGTNSLIAEVVEYHAYFCRCPDGWTGHNCQSDFAECASGPCENGATCSDSSTNPTLSYGTYSCTCALGYSNGVCEYEYADVFGAECNIQEGGNCDMDVNECMSLPCANGAACYDSNHPTRGVAGNRYSCSCVAGFANGWCEYEYIELVTASCTTMEGGNCDEDVNECLSNPCQNNAQCTDSSDNANVPYDSYSCACVPGTTGGRCAYNFRDYYSYVCGTDPDCATCRVAHTTRGQPGGSCETDFDECASGPCQNGGTCTESKDPAALATFSDSLYGSYSCTCAAGFASGLCEYSFITEYTSDCMVPLDANCDIDVDECASSPCDNGATCSDSTVEPAVSFHAYQCTCVAGFANGWCEYDFITEVTEACRVLDSRQNGAFSGNCDIDVDECASSPCQNGASCTESAYVYDATGSGDGGDILFQEHSFHAYSCSCAPGFANGVCEYDFITNYTEACQRWEGGNCDDNVNECVSSPCENGATCSDPVGVYHVYTCTCVAGFSNGVCEYVYPAELESECSVTYGGNCDEDLDECASHPCENGAQCVESRSDHLPDVSIYSFRCLCTHGFADGFCAYTPLDVYTSECAVLESSVATEQWGLNGGNSTGRCTLDINECISSPCQNGAACTDSCITTNTSTKECLDNNTAIPPDLYSCDCMAGYSNGVCNYNYPDGTTPGSYGALGFGVGFTVGSGDESLEPECTVAFGGNCDKDLDECASNPCQHHNATDNTCSESSLANSAVPIDAYSCACRSGFAHGNCTYDFPETYSYLCNVAEGECDVDIDECWSNPCLNGAVCLDSSDGQAASGVDYPHDEFTCSCQPGYSEGVCEYEHTNSEFYNAHCAIYNSGRCSHDVDECDSIPCQNGGACSDSTTIIYMQKNAYACVCLPGFASPEGNCEVDIDECTSSPCLHENHTEALTHTIGVSGTHVQTCIDSSVSADVLPDAWACLCVPGWTGTYCDTDYDECSSNPCQSGSICDESTHYGQLLEEGGADHHMTNATGNITALDQFACYCSPGFTGHQCDINIDDCASSPCLNGGQCEDHVDEYQCFCTPGYDFTSSKIGHDEHCSKPVDLCVIEEWGYACDYNSGATCEYLGPGKKMCHCNEPYELDPTYGNVSCREHVNMFPYIMGAVLSSFAVFMCVCYGMAMRSQRAYAKLMNMEGMQVGSRPSDPWIVRKVTSFFRSNEYQKGGGRRDGDRAQAAVDELGRGVKNSGRVVRTTERIQKGRRAEDIVKLRNLIAQDPQLRLIALQNDAAQILLVVLLKSKSFEARKATKEALAQLLPGKVTDIPQHVAMLHSPVAGLPSLSAAILRKICEDRMTGHRSVKMLADTEAFNFLIAMLQQRAGEETEAARLMYILVSGNQDHRQAALRLGIADPLLRLWHRRRRHAARNIVGRLLTELSADDESLKEQMTPSAAVVWDEDAGVPELVEQIASGANVIEDIRLFESILAAGERERQLGIKNDGAETLFSHLIESTDNDIKISASSALAVLLPAKVEDAAHMVTLLTSTVRGLPSYAAALINRCCEGKGAEVAKNKTALADAGAMPPLVAMLKSPADLSEAVKAIETLTKGHPSNVQLALRCAITRPLIDVCKERGKVDVTGAVANRLLADIAQGNELVTQEVELLADNDDAGDAMMALQELQYNSDDSDSGSDEHTSELLGGCSGRDIVNMRTAIKNLKTQAEPADAKTLEQLIADNEEMRKYVLTRGVVEAIYLMLLRSQSTDTKAAAQSALNALMPGKISDTGYQVKLLESKVAGLPGYSAGMLRKLCEDPRVSNATLSNRKEWIVDAGAVPKLVALLKRRGEETEAARALAVLVTGADEIRRLALRAGATEPLLKLRARGQHDGAGLSANKALTELSRIDISIVMKLDDVVRQTMEMKMLDRQKSHRHKTKVKSKEKSVKREAHKVPYKAVKPAVVRRDFDRNSPKVGELKPGEVIQALETVQQLDMPTRIRFPGGWVSVQSQTGVQLLEKIEEKWESSESESESGDYTSSSEESRSGAESESSSSADDRNFSSSESSSFMTTGSSSSSSSSSFMTESESSDDDQGIAPAKQTDPIETLMRLGLTRQQAAVALKAAGGNVEQARQALTMESSESDFSTESESSDDESPAPDSRASAPVSDADAIKEMMGLGLSEPQAKVALQTADGDLKKTKAALWGDSDSSSDSESEGEGRRPSAAAAPGGPVDKETALQQLMSAASLTKVQAEAALSAANGDVASAMAAFADDDFSTESDSD